MKYKYKMVDIKYKYNKQIIQMKQMMADVLEEIDKIEDEQNK